ncbi:MAG: NYN domain-containing protein [Eubacteriales bacterium]|nr:NYN domain-containing protein [Eubacteriales bacterium]MDD4541749.1 NYN domain-containing protein [Eubacteriales bacterium]
MTTTNNATNDVRLAVLIDADNVPPHNVQAMMEEIARYGTPTIKRIYGDWTRPSLTQWKSHLLDYAISPIQQFSYTSGKNSTDSALIIDAMDILYAGNVDGFCLVSSDSDFTRLATRLREAGKIVYGMGEMKTPNPFIAACDRFIFLEVLQRNHDESQAVSEVKESEPKKTTARQDNSSRPRTQRAAKDKTAINKIDRKLINLISSSIKDVEDDNGWAFLAEVGNMINKKQPSFDSRNYGFDKLSNLVQSIDKFEVQMRDTGNPNVKLVYVRVKNGRR